MDDATATGKEFDEELKRHSSAGKKRHNHGIAIAICCLSQSKKSMFPTGQVLSRHSGMST